MRSAIRQNCQRGFEYAGGGRLRITCDPCQPQDRFERGRLAWRLLRERTGKDLCADCGVSYSKSPESKVRHCEGCRKKRSEAQREKNQERDRRRAAEISEARKAKRLVERPWLVPGLSTREKVKLKRRLCPETIARLRRYKKLRRENERNAIRRAAMAGAPSRKFSKSLGYTATELRRHLERQFTSGMTWEGFMAGEIEIDHRVPLACFDLTKREEFIAAYALPNLQPLWAGDNRRKGGRRLYLL